MSLSRISIIPGDDLLRRYGNALGQLGENDGHKALARAVNRTTNTVYSRTVRAISKQSSIPTKVVRRHMHKLTVRPGGGGALEGKVFASGRPIPIKEFRPKQFSYGVKVKLWGKMQRLEGMFIKAGHFRSSQDVANGHVFQRVTSKSLPIELQYGPSVPEELVRDESAAVFERTVADMLPKRVAHEIGRLLPDG